jgi:hypothetical protein
MTEWSVCPISTEGKGLALDKRFSQLILWSENKSGGLFRYVIKENASPGKV